MEVKTRRRRATHPISHYWGLVKEFFDAITIIPVSPILDRYAEEKARLTLAGGIQEF